MDGSFGRWKIPAARGGGGRARSALKARGRGPWPRPRAFVWQAGERPCGPPPGRQTPPPPGVTQRRPATPRQRTSAGPTAVAHGKRKGRGVLTGGAAFCRPFGPAKPKPGPGAKAPGPGFARALGARRPPRGARISAAAKRQRKARPHALWGRAHERRQDGARQQLHPSGKAAAHALRAAAALSAPPRAAIPGRPRPLVRDYRRPRRAAARAGPRSMKGWWIRKNPANAG